MKKKLLLLVLAAMSLSVAYPQKTDLRLNLKKGASYYQKNNSACVVEMTFGDQAMEVGVEVYTETSYRVIEKHGEYYDMEVRCLDMKVAVDSPKANLALSRDEPGMMGPLFDNVIGESFYMKVNRKGRVMEITGFEDIMVSLFGDKYMGAGMREGLDKLEEVFKNNFNMVLVTLPEKRVAVNGEWESDISLDLGMPVNIDMVYRYMGKKTGRKVVCGNGGLDFDMNVNTGDTAVSFDIKGEVVSEAKLDKRTGWVAEAGVLHEYCGNLCVKTDKEEVKGNMTVKFSSTVTGW